MTECEFAFPKSQSEDLSCSGAAAQVSRDLCIPTERTPLRQPQTSPGLRAFFLEADSDKISNPNQKIHVDLKLLPDIAPQAISLLLGNLLAELWLPSQVPGVNPSLQPSMTLCRPKPSRQRPTTAPQRGGRMLQNHEHVAVLYFPARLYHEVSPIMLLWLHQSYLNFSTNKLEYIHSPITAL